MNITFYPESDTPAFISAAREYQDIWEANRQAYVDALESQTDLKFSYKSLNALVFEGPSRSHPLILRASYSREIKAATLVHELGHKLLSANNLRVEYGIRDSHINGHKLLNLFLYDVYVTLFGEAKAIDIVELESSRRSSYHECWQWALNLTKAERAARFTTIKEHRPDWLPHLDF